ncbi:Na+/H+ antiporter [Umbelopsis sp. WA50703]
MTGITVFPGEISPFTEAIAVLSGFIVIFGFVSMFVKEKLFISEAFVAVVVGIIAGPLVSNGINPYSWQDTDEITKQLTRCVIAIQVMASGIELPKHYLKKEWVSMFMLLGPVMVYMWLMSGLFIWWLIPPLNYLESLAIAACVTPTDPILANSVVKGRFAEKHVPAHIRNALSAESGANDGMGFPFLFLAVYLLSEPTVGEAIGKWFYLTWLFQIALSCVIGLVVGYVARKILQWSERNRFIDKPSFLCFAIALALFLMSMTGFSGSDDLLACFVAGNAFSWDDWFRQETEEAHFQDVIDMMLNLAVFVYIGCIIPWSSFSIPELGVEPWRLVVIAILILLFRRLPIVLLLKPVLPALKTYREAFFAGWFGPMGVGAVFLSILAKEELEKVHGEKNPASVELIAPIVLFIVLSSVLVHGTTIPLFQLGKRIHTRTLSIASSHNQVSRLPKLQFGQTLSFHRDDDARSGRSGHSRDLEMSLSRTERNTLFNTPQARPSTGRGEPDSSGENTVVPAESSSPEEFAAVDMTGASYSDDDDVPDEEFLPNDDEEVNNSMYGIHPADAEGNEPRNPPPPTHLQSDAQTDSQRGSTGNEMSSIRFLEPVKPRSATQASINVERNESSVTSLRGLFSKASREERDSMRASEDSQSKRRPSQPEIALTEAEPTAEKKKWHGRGGFIPKTLRGLFESPAAQSPGQPGTGENQTTVPETGHEPLPPRIQVWEESHRVVIEDANDMIDTIVIDKSDPEWRSKAKQTVADAKQKGAEMEAAQERGTAGDENEKFFED